MASLEAKIQVDVSAAVQQALIDFARECEKKHGIMINSVDFDWQALMGGSGVLTGCNMNTRKVG